MNTPRGKDLTDAQSKLLAKLNDERVIHCTSFIGLACPSGDPNALGYALVERVGLSEVKVSLDLVDGGNDLGLGHKTFGAVFGEV